MQSCDLNFKISNHLRRNLINYKHINLSKCKHTEKVFNTSDMRPRDKNSVPDSEIFSVVTKNLVTSVF